MWPDPEFCFCAVLHWLNKESMIPSMIMLIVTFTETIAPLCMVNFVIQEISIWRCPITFKSDFQTYIKKMWYEYFLHENCLNIYLLSSSKGLLRKTVLATVKTSVFSSILMFYFLCSLSATRRVRKKILFIFKNLFVTYNPDKSIQKGKWLIFKIGG